MALPNLHVCHHEIQEVILSFPVHPQTADDQSSHAAKISARGYKILAVPLPRSPIITRRPPSYPESFRDHLSIMSQLSPQSPRVGQSCSSDKIPRVPLYLLEAGALLKYASCHTKFRLEAREIACCGHRIFENSVSLSPAIFSSCLCAPFSSFWVVSCNLNSKWHWNFKTFLCYGAGGFALPASCTVWSNC